MSLSYQPLMKPARNKKKEQEVACEGCGLFALCRTAGMDSPNSPDFRRLVKRRVPVAKGEHLFRPGEKLDALYAVKSGAIVTTPEEGHEHGVSGFYLPGEVLGLEAMADNHYRHEARALTQTSVCRLELDELGTLGDRQATFTQALMQLMSHQLHQEYRLFQLLGTHSTEQRLATFLLNYANRLRNNGMPYLEFRLPMTRRDIADYLGIALETVSRVLKQFQDRGLLEVRGKMTRICNVDGLKSLAIRWHGDATAPSPHPA